MELAAGIEIGGTKLQLVVGNEEGGISERKKFAVDPEKGGAGIRDQIQQTVPELMHRRKVCAIGVGFGGPVDWRTGRICRSHQIEGWSEFDLTGWLQSLAGAPVFVDNDANVAALGEANHGAGVGCNPVFYVTLGSGVGGGLVVNGDIYHGMTPGEAEIGHVRLDRTGAIVESKCSGWAVNIKVRKLITVEPHGLLAQLVDGSSGHEAKHLGAALAQGDPAAKQLVAEVAEDLAFGLSHVVHLIHPQSIVLGGGLAGIGEPLRAAVETALEPFVMDAFAPGPKVVIAALGEDAVPIGALELAARRRGVLKQSEKKPPEIGGSMK